MNQLLERLRKDLSNEDSRYAYADAVTNAYVSAQIKALKEDRDLKQGQLADLIGTQQSGISRLLRSDYSAWSVETLRKLARAFGVRLRVSFEEFGTLIDDVSGFNKKNLLPRKFEDDPVFNTAHVVRRRSQATRRFRFSITTKARVSGQRRKKSTLGDVPIRKPPYPETRLYGEVEQKLTMEFGQRPASGNNNFTAIASVSGNQSTGQPGVSYGD